MRHQVIESIYHHGADSVGEKVGHEGGARRGEGRGAQGAQSSDAEAEDEELIVIFDPLERAKEQSAGAA